MDLSFLPSLDLTHWSIAHTVILVLVVLIGIKIILSSMKLLLKIVVLVGIILVVGMAFGVVTFV